MKGDAIKALCLVAVLTLGGCATATPMMTPSGQQGFSIDCSAITMAQCYEKAGSICGANGYKVYNSVDKRAGFFTSSEKQMVISCNAPKH